MVEKELIDYIKSTEAQGYAPQQLRSFLIKQGHSAKDVDEALRVMGKAPPTAATPTPAAAAAPAGGIKKRNPVLVFIFSIITFGIYAIYWLVATTNELRKNTTSAPNPLLLLLFLIPFVNIVVAFIYYWKYSKAINELTGFSAALLFVLWIFINPVAMVFAQIELNKKAG